MEQSVFRFSNPEAGYTLAGEFLSRKPDVKNVDGKEKVTVLAHGLCAHRKAGFLPKIAVDLPTSAFSLDFAGNGESEGPWHMAAFKREVGDLKAAVEFLRGTHNMDVVAILGHSKGAGTVLLYAATYDGDIPKIINVAARRDMRGGFVDRFSAQQLQDLEEKGSFEWKMGSRPAFVVTKAMREDREATDLSVVSQVRRTLLLHVHGTGDTTIPFQDSQTFHAETPGSKLVLVEGASHSFDRSAHYAALRDAVLQFINA